MQIHDLNTGTPAATHVLAMDTGSDTYKTTPGNVVPDYTSGDSSTATSWTSVTAVASGLSFSTLIGRITTMMKNVRFLYGLLGNTDISGIGGGTVTGAISTLNSNFIKQVDGVTALTNIQPGFGYYQLAASISPTGTQQYFAMICSGIENRRAFLAIATSSNEWYATSYHYGGSPALKPWRKIDTTAL